MKVRRIEDTPLGERFNTEYELPEKLLPFVTTTVNPVNGKTYAKVTNEEYARALARRVPPIAGENKGPKHYSWEVVG